MAALLAVSLALIASAVAAPANAFKGIVGTAQYRCDDFLCPDWELDVARVDPAFRVHLITKLAELVPKSPVASMSFPVLTAYHDPTRTFYTVGLPEQAGGTIWAVQVNAAADNSTMLTSARFDLPSGVGSLSRVHATRNNTVLAIFDSGALFTVDPKSGSFTKIGSVIPSNVTGFKASQASVIDTDADILYTILSNSDNAVISTLYLQFSRLTSAPITLKREHYFLEALPTALWIPTAKRVALFLAGKDSGFDQIAYIEPATGNGEFLFDNLAESNLFFMCDMNTKSCDTLQTATYDPQEDRIYFQATNIVGDDVGTTVLMFVDLTHKNPYIDTGLNPFTFGYMGFHWIPVLASN